MAAKGKMKCKEATLEELVEEAQALLEEKPAKSKKDKMSSIFIVILCLGLENQNTNIIPVLPRGLQKATRIIRQHAAV